MAKIPAGAIIGRQKIPAGAKIGPDEGVEANAPRMAGDPVTPEAPGILDPSSKLGAAAQGITQGGSLGFGDEAMAAADVAGEAGKRLRQAVGLESKPVYDADPLDKPGTTEPRPAPSLADVYRNAREGYRKDLKTSEAAHPVVYGAGELAGGLAVPIPGSGLMKGAPLAAKVGLGAIQAAGLGTAIGAGKSEADLTKGDVGGFQRDALETGFKAAPFGVLGGTAAHGAEKLGPYFAGKAGERAFQAAGARAGITDRAAKMGISEAQMPVEGRKFLEAGLIPTGLNPFRSPLKQTAQRAKALMESGGGKIGEAIDAAEASGAVFDPVQAQNAMRAKMNVMDPIDAANAGKANTLVDQVGELTPQGEYASSAGFRQAQDMKSKAWKGADFRQDAALTPEMYKRSVRGLRDDLQSQIGAATSPEIEASLAAGNKAFSTGAKASTLSEMALSRDAQKQQFSPLRTMIASAAGAGGGAFSGPTGAGVGAVLSPLVINAIAARGPNFAAHFNELASKASTSTAAASALQNLASQLGIKVEDLYQSKPQTYAERFGVKGTP